jgi:hypothetical protein
VWTVFLGGSGLPVAPGGTALSFAESYAGGLPNASDVFVNPLTILSDVSSLDLSLHNTGPDPIDAFFYELNSSTFVSWSALGVGATQLLNLPLAQGPAHFFMTAATSGGSSSNPLAWDMTLTPQP